MTRKFLFFSLLLSCFALGAFAQKSKLGKLNIEWVNNLDGDFSFKDMWEYPEWIFENAAGQLVCDGFCPDGLETMRNNEGILIPDSIPAYYQLVDTTHQYYTVAIDDWGTDSLWFAQAQRMGKDAVQCRTVLGVSTYWSLNLFLMGNYCHAQIDFHSPTPRGHWIMQCEKGTIKIDWGLWHKDILKAAFDFTFIDQTQRNEKIRWRGRLYTAVKSREKE